MRTLLLLCLLGCATPAMAECRFTSALGYGSLVVNAGDDPGKVRLEITDAAPKTCDYRLGGGDEGGNAIKCKGEAAMPFLIIPAQIDGTTGDIIIFYNETAWYRDPICDLGAPKP